MKRRSSFAGDYADVAAEDQALGHEDLRYGCRGKSCYCSRCGGLKYYMRFQKRINLYPLPAQLERLNNFMRATKYIRMVLFASASGRDGRLKAVPRKPTSPDCSSGLSSTRHRGGFSAAAARSPIALKRAVRSAFRDKFRAFFPASAGSNATKNRTARPATGSLIPRAFPCSGSKASELIPQNVNFAKSMLAKMLKGKSATTEIQEERKKIRRPTIILLSGMVLPCDEEDASAKKESPKKPKPAKSRRPAEGRMKKSGGPSVIQRMIARSPPLCLTLTSARKAAAGGENRPLAPRREWLPELPKPKKSPLLCRSPAPVEGPKGHRKHKSICNSLERLRPYV